MEFTKDISKQTITIAIKGRIDTSNAEEFENIVLQEIKKDFETVIDFSSITYISSAALRVLLSAYKLSAQNGGKLILINVNELVMEILDMTGLSSILDIKD